MSTLMMWSLKLMGEPLRWCVQEGSLRPLLEKAGFNLGPADRFDLRQRYLVPVGVDQPVGQMERFAVAEWR